jgi:hypothetical protein
MDGCRHLAQAFHATVMVDTQLPGGGLSGGAYVSVTADDQPNAAPGNFFHEYDEGRGTVAVFSGHSFPGGGTDKSIGKC